jgi:hypothetical protein
MAAVSVEVIDRPPGFARVGDVVSCLRPLRDVPSRPMKTSLLVVAALMLVTMAVAARPASAACDPTPRAGCKLPAVPHKSSLTFFQTGGHDPDDVFTWRWKAGSQTSVADFGNPPATDYTFCIYDSSPRPQPVVADSADNPSDWKTKRNGFSYLVRGEHPLRTARLHAGPDGKANVSAHGNADTTATLLPFVAPVIVQLQASNGQCWETDFAAPSRSNEVAFIAKD